MTEKEKLKRGIEGGLKNWYITSPQDGGVDCSAYDWLETRGFAMDALIHSCVDECLDVKATPMPEKHWIDKIPMRLKQALVRYREHGIPTGGGLEGMLKNNLKEFLFAADEETRGCALELLWWLNRFMPAMAWGAETWVKTWIATDGMEGLEEEKQESWRRKTQNELNEIGRDSEI